MHFYYCGAGSRRRSTGHTDLAMLSPVNLHNLERLRTDISQDVLSPRPTPPPRPGPCVRACGLGRSAFKAERAGPNLHREAWLSVPVHLG